MECQACGQDEAVAGRVVCADCLALASARGGALHRIPVLVRLYGRVNVVGECWEFEATGRDGYGTHIKYGGVQKRPHWLALHLTERWPGEPYEADHVCNNRACCNPAHLQWLTLQENRHKRRNTLSDAERRARRAAYQRQYRRKHR